jgi:hypothetical protein
VEPWHEHNDKGVDDNEAEGEGCEIVWLWGGIAIIVEPIEQSHIEQDINYKLHFSPPFTSQWPGSRDNRLWRQWLKKGLKP